MQIQIWFFANFFWFRIGSAVGAERCDYTQISPKPPQDQAYLHAKKDENRSDFRPLYPFRGSKRRAISPKLGGYLIAQPQAAVNESYPRNPLHIQQREQQERQICNAGVLFGVGRGGLAHIRTTSNKTTEAFLLRLSFKR